MNEGCAKLNFRERMSRYASTTDGTISHFLDDQVTLRVYVDNEYVKTPPSTEVLSKRSREKLSPLHYTSFWRSCNMYGFSVKRNSSTEDIRYLDVTHTNPLFCKENPRFVLDEKSLKRKAKRVGMMVNGRKNIDVLRELFVGEDTSFSYSLSENRVISFARVGRSWCVSKFLEESGVCVKWGMFQRVCESCGIEILSYDFVEVDEKFTMLATFSPKSLSLSHVHTHTHADIDAGEELRVVYRNI